LKHIATHDGIGLGEDGPTHQPIGISAFFRSEPGIRLYRPADAEETMGAWIDALANAKGPSVLCLSRQNVELLAGSKREGVEKGAYVVTEPEGGDPNIILVATGSEMSLAQQVAKQLDGINLRARVVSMPCMENFKRQSRAFCSPLLWWSEVLQANTAAPSSQVTKS
jgi:transketolase